MIPLESDRSQSDLPNDHTIRVSHLQILEPFD